MIRLHAEPWLPRTSLSAFFQVCGEVPQIHARKDVNELPETGTRTRQVSLVLRSNSIPPPILLFQLWISRARIKCLLYLAKGIIKSDWHENWIWKRMLVAQLGCDHPYRSKLSHLRVIPRLRFCLDARRVGALSPMCHRRTCHSIVHTRETWMHVAVDVTTAIW